MMLENGPAEAMDHVPLRDIRDVAWFERSTNASVSALHLTATRLYAGDWNGLIHCWDLDGDEIWNVQTTDRVSGFALGGDFVYAACGRDLVCIGSESGDIQWVAELEGSCDLVACTPDGQTVIATSSVFDIEVNDFMESKCWRYDSQGNLQRDDTLDERPWFIQMRSDGIAHLALGRPRCGMTRADQDGLNWYPLPTKTPATCGLSGQIRVVIGHVDGTLTCIDEGIVLEEGPFPKQPGSITNLDCTPNGLIVSVSIESGPIGAGFGGAEGLARAYNSDGYLRWQIETPKGHNIEHVIDGPDLNNNPSVWIVSWDGVGAEIAVHAELDGNEEARFKPDSRVNSCVCENDYIAFGFDDGKVILIQSDLLVRRLKDGEDSTSTNKADLAARLRALRKNS